MSTQTNKQLVQELFEKCMNGKDYSVVAGVVSPEYINYTFSGGKAGAEAFADAVRQFHGGFPDLKLNIENIAGDGDFVATQGHWTGTHSGDFMGIPATGKRVKVDYIDFWKFKNGKAVENWVQMNMPAMMEQLGVAPAMAH